MQQTLIIFKPSAMARGLVGEVLGRFERKGLTIAAMKMMQLTPEILREHYAHLVDRPFFPSILASMTATPVVVMVLEGVDAIPVVRQLTGATNGRNAAAGTIRGDYSMSGQENIIHASSSPEDAEAEIKRFFSFDEIFKWSRPGQDFFYSGQDLEE